MAGLIFFEGSFEQWLEASALTPAQSLLGELGQMARYLGHLAAHPLSAAPGLPYGLCVLLILGSHEMGHYLACRRYRVSCTLPYFIPVPVAFGTFGAVIRIRGAIPDRRALFDIGIAGPIAGFVPTVAVLAYGLLHAQVLPAAEASGEALVFGDSLLSGLLIDWLVTGEGERIVVPSIYVAGWLGMLATALNLFPVGQLDGGHVTYALSRRAHRLVSRLTIAGMLLLMGWSVIRALSRGTALPSLMLWTVVLILLGSRHPPVRDETRPLGAGRKVLALLGLLIFVLCFMANPLQVV